MAYGRNRTKEMNPVERGRVQDLIDMHDEGVINLKDGPWKYYGYEIGNPHGYMKPEIKDYSECLTK